jgi:hypothetical protein
MNPYSDPMAGQKYWKWGSARKWWIDTVLPNKVRATRYRDWHSKAYIHSHPMYEHVNERSYQPFAWHELSHTLIAAPKAKQMLARKPWKILNSRTEYLYLRDFK